MREHDDGGGRPKVVPEKIIELGSQSHQAQEEPFKSAVFETSFDDKAASNSPKWTNPFAAQGLVSVILLVLGFMTLWVMSQVVAFSRDLLNWPWLLRAPTLVLVALLLSYMAFHSWRFWRAFKSLRIQRQLSLKDLDQLERRKDLQTQSIKHYRQAIGHYLKDYDFKNADLCKRLVAVGFSDETLLQLESTQRRLLEGEWADSQTWLEFYLQQFQKIVDQIASERIRKTSLRIGIASASCPQKTLDLLIVLGGSLQLNADLCTIYRLKLGRVGLFGLLIRSFRNSFIAMNLEDVSDHFIDQMTDHWKEHASGFASHLGTLIGTRLAEGGANALLLARLGHCAKKQLQPLKA